MELTPELIQGITDYITKASALLDEVSATHQKMASMAPSVVDDLIKAGLLTADKREQFIGALQDPCEALVSLQKTAQSLTTEPTPMGTSESEAEKTASVETYTSTKSNRDRVFEEKLGL